MKYTFKKGFGKDFIGYDNTAPTAWITLSALIAFIVWLFLVPFSTAFAIEYTKVYEAKAAEVTLEDLKIELEQIQKEVNRQEFLKHLRFCESSNRDHIKGDGGASVGPYQWQKSTLEDKMDKKLTYAQYYEIATNYEKIHAITYKTYFEDGESWRWKICTNKIKKQKTWNL